MANIVIIGAGVMGSALTVPATDNENQVTLVGTHLDQAIIASVKRNRFHPSLDETLPDEISPLHASELSIEHIEQADIVILGVSSAGVGWVVDLLRRLGVSIKTLSLVTKGLEAGTVSTPQTYAHTLVSRLSDSDMTVGALVGIGGPCIARELVVRQPTTVVYASADAIARDHFAECMSTPQYRVFRSDDVIGVEACAALKNFLAIGVSAMISRYQMHAGSLNEISAKNPTAAVFNQAVRELALLCQWIGGDRDTAFDQAGLGDLHVTVGGGRNSRLGVCLGQGLTLHEALKGPLSGQTVEGKDTGRILLPALYAAIERKQLNASEFPLTLSILRAIESNTPFDFNFNSLAVG